MAGKRILYTVCVYEGGHALVKQHQRSLNPEKDVVVHAEHEFVPDKLCLNVVSPSGGRLKVRIPPDEHHMHGNVMRRVASPQRRK